MKQCGVGKEAEEVERSIRELPYINFCVLSHGRGQHFEHTKNRMFEYSRQDTRRGRKVSI